MSNAISSLNPRNYEEEVMQRMELSVRPGTAKDQLYLLPYNIIIKGKELLCFTVRESLELSLSSYGLCLCVLISMAGISELTMDLQRLYLLPYRLRALVRSKQFMDLEFLVCPFYLLKPIPLNWITTYKAIGKTLMRINKRRQGAVGLYGFEGYESVYRYVSCPYNAMAL